MRTIDEYMDLAKARNGLQSDRQLAAALGMKPTLPSTWRTKRAWPSDDVMVRLAELSDIAPTEALLELNAWRAGPQSQPFYELMLRKIAGVLIIAALSAAAFSPSTSMAAVTKNELNSLYYEEKQDRA